MPSPKLVDLDYAAELVEPGSSVTVSGITFVRNPSALVAALVERGARDLCFIDREPGFALDVMAAAGLLRCVRAAMASFELYGLAPTVRRLAERGEVEYIEDTCGAVIAGLRAGAQGVPFMPARGILGSQLLELHEKRWGTWRRIRDPWTGEELVAVRAIEPDYALVHVHVSDPYGNAVIEGPRFEDELKIRAARHVIISAERIVEPEELRGFRHTLSATSLHVDAVVHAPRGAWPTAMPGLYRADYEAIRGYVEAARQGRAMEWVKANLSRMRG
ncbi:CoA transferase subunit A [Pyrodictium occultum]|uniref:CoA transferase subunit A n=1 Tax=Pyrodictium occultum TaxID=2309 RepID=UPI0008A8C877|nr:CoA-transferase [Pyrodictium occultum]